MDYADNSNVMGTAARLSNSDQVLEAEVWSVGYFYFLDARNHIPNTDLIMGCIS
jgi:hypothetical protein